MTAWHIAVLLVAGLAAGAVNAVAGGGTLLTFPALLAVGLSPVSANVSNTVAVWPGYLSSAVSYRGQWKDRKLLVRLAVASALGGVVGTVVLLSTPAKVFHEIVPYLVFAATGLLAAQPAISRRMAARRTEPVDPDHTSPLLPGAIFLAAGYGAYFGGGLGIVLLAVLALGIPIDLGRLNALKTYLQLLINTVALIGFALFGPVGWAAAAVVAPASFIGGIGGARVAQRLDPRVLRVAIVIFGVGVGIRLLVG
ncbi:sulfite exporter TauE/SafE family protein [Acidothermaceae bacterium B102]|nr:sulfite exporter TauE/SafE family protein [Acidothermaceae bacterium B102]